MGVGPLRAPEHGEEALLCWRAEEGAWPPFSLPPWLPKVPASAQREEGARERVARHADTPENL